MKSIFIFIILIFIALYILFTDRTDTVESFSLKSITDQYEPKIRISEKIYKKRNQI